MLLARSASDAALSASSCLVKFSPQNLKGLAMTVGEFTIAPRIRDAVGQALSKMMRL
jgi:hypothetical protein